MNLGLLLLNCLIPGKLLLIGSFWKKHPPKKINRVYGYRSALSSKNQETWEFAHAYHAQVLLWFGGALLVLSLLSMLICQGDPKTATLWTVSIQAAILVLSIFPTELALRRRFDKEGKRRLKY